MTNELPHVLEGMIPHDKRGQYVRVPRFAWNALMVLLAVLLMGAMTHAGWLALQNWALQKRVTSLETDRQSVVHDLTGRVSRLENENEKQMALFQRFSSELRDIKAGVDYLRGKAERAP